MALITAGRYPGLGHVVDRPVGAPGGLHDHVIGEVMRRGEHSLPGHREARATIIDVGKDPPDPGPAEHQAAAGDRAQLDPASGYRDELVFTTVQPDIHLAGRPAGPRADRDHQRVGARDRQRIPSAGSPPRATPEGSGRTGTTTLPR